MQVDKLNALWGAYRARTVDPTIHPADHMFKTNPALDDYNVVGESGVKVIHSVLAMAPKEGVWRIMDFGCGHGRVARHIRSLFPTAEMFFVDIEEDGVEFCAERFGGVPVRSSPDLSKLDLPKGMDLIWVGSVFTHLDYGRMEALFDALFDALGLGGILIATFRGRRMYDITKGKPDQAKLYQTMLAQYETDGAGYQSYGRAELGDWGLSLTSIEKVVALGKRHANARLIGYSEAGWANVHDVGAWMKT